ncbi:hypothetical protein TGME49_213670 [Toxoplasma gondii ME49]|uniref:Formation of crista junctions protein 1 n=2 Tax=Toxoplasma gondii TaxID=5811 RepID=S8F910_TOXGM|nr:hypothetical protein TGME49_213670 [Toxoplasma gondii ME49]EPT31247.1 hypothetical protein TGME49_213670 [Toxoplasma gondii ME49]KYF43698.1 inner membrane protein [Toxoplasma gondii ARI]|eukprot:XP_018637899.1 hypothetical protein TGME49_213670 [Toxoplasma gondii ME49]
MSTFSICSGATRPPISTLVSVGTKKTLDSSSRSQPVRRLFMSSLREKHFPVSACVLPVCGIPYLADSRSAPFQTGGRRERNAVRRNPNCCAELFHSRRSSHTELAYTLPRSTQFRSAGFSSVPFFCLSSPKLAAETKVSGDSTAISPNTRGVPTPGASLHAEASTDKQAKDMKQRRTGRTVTKFLAGAVLLGLGAVGAAVVLDADTVLKSRLASRAPEVVKFLEATVIPLLSLSGLAAYVPAIVAPTNPALSPTPPLFPSSAPAAPLPQPALSRPELSSPKSPGEDARESVPSVAGAKTRDAPASVLSEKREASQLKDEQKTQNTQDQLSPQDEKLQMELLFQLLSHLSDSQKGSLGLLPAAVKTAQPTHGGKCEVPKESTVEAQPVPKAAVKESTETHEKSVQSTPVLMSVEEAVSAEKEAIRHLSVEALRERLLDLASQLAIARRYDALRRAEDVQKLQGEVAVAYDQKLKTEIEKERGRAAETVERLVLAKAKEIEESANRRLAEELKVQCELRDEREAQERRQMVLDLVELEGQVLGLHAAFDALSLRAQQAQAVNSLMSVVAEIDNALEMSAPVLPQLKKLQEMSRLDPILFSALNSLPCEVTEATHRPVPTAGDLKVSIKKNLRECIQAAFIPPHSGIFGHLLARAFSWFYVLEPHPPPIDPETSADPSRAVAEAADLAGGINAESALNDRESSAGTGDSTSRDGLAKLRRNLALLSYASFYVDRGHLGNALRCLEQLDGLSRAVSLEEIQRLRVFLLLHQTLQLAKARLACINADLLAGAKSP